MEVMKGKKLVSIIINGNLAMKNGIKKVFSYAYHCLCAWHLLLNTTSNVGVNSFLQSFKKSMFGDYKVDKFEVIWETWLLSLD